MSIATQLTALQTDKENIASAITAKGGTLSQNPGFDTFAKDVETIPAGASEAETISKYLRREITHFTPEYFSGLTELNAYAFSRNNTVESIELSDTITALGDYSVNNCTNLVYFSCDNAPVTAIKVGVFNYSVLLQSLKFPATLESIGDSALRCGSTSNRCTFTFLSTVPPTIRSNTFNVATISKIIVPYGCGSAYRNATNWSALADYIEEAEA